MRFFRSDLLASVEGEYDLIVANLPYIDSAIIPTLAREVQHDPLSALDGGANGLALLRRLIAEAPKCLRGRLALEVSAENDFGDLPQGRFIERLWQAKKMPLPSGPFAPSPSPAAAPWSGVRNCC